MHPARPNHEGCHHLGGEHGYRAPTALWGCRVARSIATGKRVASPHRYRPPKRHTRRCGPCPRSAKQRCRARTTQSMPPSGVCQTGAVGSDAESGVALSITKLKGPAKGTYFRLYVILDIFSRYVVGWQSVKLRNWSSNTTRCTMHFPFIPSSKLDLHAVMGNLDPMLCEQCTFF